MIGGETAIGVFRRRTLTTPNHSRETILTRVRNATQTTPYPGPSITAAYDGIPRCYVRNGSLSSTDKLALLTERLREYDATVVACSPERLVATIEELLANSGRFSFVVPPDLTREWMIGGFDWILDEDLSYDDVERAQGVVTGAFCAVADSGTIVLDHGAQQGRRLLTLLPDWHLCVLRSNQIVETLPEYFALLSQPPAFVTWISGPSATADIEMTRIRGVHGPRFLNVILVHN